MARSRLGFLVVCVLSVLLLGLGMSGQALETVRGKSSSDLAESTTTLYAAMDSHVLEASPTSNHGSEDQLVVGLEQGIRGEYEARTLVYFDLTGALPPGATLVSAHLELYQNASTGDRGFWIWAEPAAQSWSESKVTWDSMPLANSTGDSEESLSTSDGWKSWDVTEAATGWLHGRVPNYGLVLRGDGKALGARGFASRETRSMPRLVLAYAFETTATATPTVTPECGAWDNPEQYPDAGLIDFDDLDHLVVIGDYYAQERGVIFENSRTAQTIIYANEPEMARSSPNVASNYVMVGPSDGIPMVIDFVSPKTHVGMYVGNGVTQNPSALLTAYDATGAVLCRQQLDEVPDPHSAFLGIHDPGGQIMRVELDYGAVSLAESIDDLHYVPADVGPTLTTSHTPTRTSTATLTPTRTATPTATRTPTPSTDLVIDDIEVTQGTQDLYNSVDLVRRKRTFVRVHFHSTSGVHPTFCQLRVFRGASNTLLYPLNSGSVSGRTFPSRGTLDHAFLFELPSYYTEGTVSMVAYLNPDTFWRDRDPLEHSYANNWDVETVTFESVPSVPLVIFRVSYRIGSTTYTASTADRYKLLSWLQRAYPLNDLDVWYRSLNMGTGSASGGDLTYPRCGDVNSALMGKKVMDILMGSSIPGSARYYGMVDDGGGFMRGCAKSIPSSVASGPTGSSSWGWDYDGCYGDWYGAHELGHAFGRGHANFCGAGGGPSYPYSYGRISPSLSGDSAIYGFDALTHEVYPPSWRDLMSYCDYEWLSDFTFHGLMSYFQSHLSSSSLSSLSGEAVDRLMVNGSIDPVTFETQLSTMILLPDVQEIQERIPGPYAIILRDGDGLELARYPFTPEGMALGPALPGSHLAELELELLAISELVPYVEGTERVDIEGPTGVLASVQAGLEPPSIVLVVPNGGETLSDDPVVLNWISSDPDGDPLRHRVQYSGDNGATWELVADELEGSTAAIESDSLPASDQGRFRVWVSDGIHTAFDTSDASFTVPNHEPELEIISPMDGATVAISQTVQFEALAYDPDVGALVGGQVAWDSDLDGPLGEGTYLSIETLSVGEHSVTAVADDGMGQVVTDAVRIEVLGDPTGLPIPDRLMADPTGIELRSDGMITATLEISNQNTGSSIPWHAESEQDWIVLSEANGMTPGSIDVSYDSRALLPGVYTGAIALTSGSVAGETRLVTVYLVLGGEGGHRLQLPLVLQP